MADDDTDTEDAPDQQASDDAGESKPEGKKDDGKDEGKGKDDKKPDSKKDEEQERRDQFAEAAGDPLADALGGSSSRAGESQAYRSWIRTVRASGAAFVGGGTIGVLNITTNLGSADRRTQAAGPVRSEVISELVNRYVPPCRIRRFRDAPAQYAAACPAGSTGDRPDHDRTAAAGQGRRQRGPVRPGYRPARVGHG